MLIFIFFFQAEDGIRDLVRSRGLGDVYKRQLADIATAGWTHLDSAREAQRSISSLALNRFKEFRLSLIHI